jgi:hypothetical protein
MKWGGADHDRVHSVGDWIIFMELFLDKAKIALRIGDTQALVNILKVTALGVAAMEASGDVDDTGEEDV